MENKKRLLDFVCFKKNRNGFTLIEILVVIAILGLLISMSVFFINNYQRKAVDIRIESDLVQIRNLAAMIYNDDINYNSLCGADNTPNENHPRFSSQLRSIENDVKSFTAQDVDCYSLGPDYCVQTVLVGGGSYCVDVFGYVGSEETHCGEKDKGKTNIKCSAP